MLLVGFHKLDLSFLADFENVGNTLSNKVLVFWALNTLIKLQREYVSSYFLKKMYECFLFLLIAIDIDVLT